MGKVNRREFFEELIASQSESTSHQTEDVLFKKYANTKLPESGKKGTASLSQYTGQWTHKEVIHLLRRLTFGVRYPDVKTLEYMTMSDAVDLLLNVSAVQPAPPVNNYNTSTYTDPTGIPLGQTWVNAAYGDSTVNGKRNYSLKSWWMGQIIKQDLTIREKMVMFWHNHFPVEILTIGDARLSYRYNQMLRTHAVGNFKTLTRQVTTDPAMLKYLNGYLNTNTAPDENYARELQELFTVGKEGLIPYKESDVIAAAKVLTGWRINTTTMSSYFQASKHDTSNKQFSACYNNKIIVGKTGTAGAGETDELIDMLFGNAETPFRICRELYRFFVYYVIDANTEATIIAPLAQTLVLNNYDIKPVLSQLFKSEHFYEVSSMDCFIRTPLDFLAGNFRTFDVQLPANFTDDKTYAIWNYLCSYSTLLNQNLGDPPDVAGWPAFHQEPEYYELWINATTLPRRFAFTDMMLNSGFSAGTGTAIKFDVLHFAKIYPNASNPNELIDFCCKLLIGLDLPATYKQSMKISTLLSGQTSDYYWMNAWNDYIVNPTTTNANIVRPRLINLITELTKMAEHHLC